jgi:hypothetical protein
MTTGWERGVWFISLMGKILENSEKGDSPAHPCLKHDLSVSFFFRWLVGWSIFYYTGGSNSEPLAC